MADQQFLLTQSILHNEQEIDLSLLRATTYIESMNLEGPVLIFKFDDTTGIIRDSYGLKEQDKIKVKLTDFQNTEVLNIEEEYTILDTAVGADKSFIVDCVDSRIADLYPRAVLAKAFIGKSASQIIKGLMPGFNKYDIDKFAPASDYWLTIGMRPLHLLMKVSADLGCALWMSRGTVHFKKLEKYQETVKPKSITYTDSDGGAEYRMYDAEKYPQQAITKELVQRNRCGWSMTKGLLKSSKYKDKPPVMTASAHQVELNNMGAGVMPVVSFMADGDSQLQPGDVLPVHWARPDMGAPIDESMPDKIILDKTTLHAEQGILTSAVEGVLPYDFS